MKKNKVESVENVNNQPDTMTIAESDLPAAEISNRTKKDQRKTSVGYTALAVILYILAFVPVVIVPIVLGVKSYELMPYYGFWPFVGVIIAAVFAIIYAVVIIVVSRKNAKCGVRGQTVKIAITFICLTNVFALLITYVFPDVIAKATQNTLFCEDLFYNGTSQAEKNASLERDYIMYNLLNGNLNLYNGDGSIAEKGDFSYTTLSKRVEEDSVFCYYTNDDIQTRYDYYMNYGDLRTVQAQIIDSMQKTSPRKYELYDFIYSNYVLNDYDYAFNNSLERRAFTLSLIDYIYTNFDYEGLLKEGWNNARLKALFVSNYDSFKNDGYLPFDDPLLLYAQENGRMTIPVVIRLILNGGWKLSQSALNEYGQPTYTEDGNTLYQLYDPDALQEFIDNGGTFDYVGKIIGTDGKEMEVNYGFNDEGWMIFENGVTKRSLDWLVLDMLGDPMALTTIDISALAGDMIAQVIQNVINMMPTLVDSLGTLVQDELIDKVLVEATGGAKLSIGICIDDNGDIAINLFPMNVPYGMLGYMQATWTESNNLLMAVINVIGLRNWLLIFGAIGIVLVIGAGVLRECGQNTRERTEMSRFRIKRAMAQNAEGEDESSDVGAETPTGEPQAQTAAQTSSV